MKESFQQQLKLDVDLSEDALLRKFPVAFRTMLLDQTKSIGGESHNIFWATNDYEPLGEGYGYESPIQIELITKEHGMVIMPRVLKDKKTQRERSKGKAEVFTPAWICNEQNNLMDDIWFEREGVFNEVKDDNKWNATEGRIEFQRKKGKNWFDYVRRNCLEITCGEAPYLVSRYDATTGLPIPISERIGLLDRKLRVVSENTKTSNRWLFWAYEAYKSTYGFEWQGDNLLLARENLFATFIDYYKLKFDKYPLTHSLNKVARIISWNLWQMDGLNGCIPGTYEECIIMNWKTRKPISFIDNIKDQTTL